MGFEYIKHYCTNRKWHKEMEDIAKSIQENIRIDKCKIDNKIVLDIGANQGLVSLPLSSLLPDCTIHSFEPAPENYNLLLKNIDNNKIKNIEVHKYGFFKEDCVADLCVTSAARYKAGNTGTYSVFFDQKEKNDSLVKADMKNFVTFLQNSDDMCERIIAMKIDAEGCEKFIITDRSLSLLKNLQVIIYECHSKIMKRDKTYAHEHERIKGYLIKHGFSQVSLKRKNIDRRVNMLNRIFVKNYEKNKCS